MLCLACTTAKGQQIIYDPDGSSQPVNRLASDVLKWSSEFAEQLNMQGWKIIIRFNPIDTSAVRTRAAATGYNIPYRIVFITVDLDVLRQDSEPWRVVLHEILHGKTVIATDNIIGALDLPPDHHLRFYVMAQIESMVVDISMATPWQKPR